MSFMQETCPSFNSDSRFSQQSRRQEWDLPSRSPQRGRPFQPYERSRQGLYSHSPSSLRRRQEFRRSSRSPSPDCPISAQPLTHVWDPPSRSPSPSRNNPVQNPSKKRKRRPKKNTPANTVFITEEQSRVKPWITDKLKTEILKKRELYQRARQTQYQDAWDEFREQRTKLTFMIREAKLMYEGKDPKVELKHVVYFCDSCERGFELKADYTKHCEEHERCSYEDCNFTGLDYVVFNHEEMQHDDDTDYASKIWHLETPEEVENWKKERKTNYPTSERIAEREAQLQNTSIFMCDTCDRCFIEKKCLNDHCLQHQKCSLDHCPYSGLVSEVQFHVKAQHDPKYAAKIWRYSSRGIADWREDRKAYWTKWRKERVIKRMPHYCEGCTEGFTEKEQYDEHCSLHEKCGFRDCLFTGTPSVLKAHLKKEHTPVERPKPKEDSKRKENSTGKSAQPKKVSKNGTTDQGDKQKQADDKSQKKEGSKRRDGNKKDNNKTRNDKDSHQKGDKNAYDRHAKKDVPVKPHHSRSRSPSHHSRRTSRRSPIRHRRSRSPVRRPRSPLRRPRSPLCRSRSPWQHSRSRSPWQHSRSPRRRSRSPRRCSRSPGRRSRSPGRRSPLHRNRSSSPRRVRSQSPNLNDSNAKATSLSKSDLLHILSSQANEQVAAPDIDLMSRMVALQLMKQAGGGDSSQIQALKKKLLTELVEEQLSGKLAAKLGSTLPMRNREILSAADLLQLGRQEASAHSTSATPAGSKFSLQSLLTTLDPSQKAQMTAQQFAGNHSGVSLAPSTGSFQQATLLNNLLNAVQNKSKVPTTQQLIANREMMTGNGAGFQMQRQSGLEPDYGTYPAAATNAKPADEKVKIAEQLASLLATSGQTRVSDEILEQLVQRSLKPRVGAPDLFASKHTEMATPAAGREDYLGQLQDDAVPHQRVAGYKECVTSWRQLSGPSATTGYEEGMGLSSRQSYGYPAGSSGLYHNIDQDAGPPQEPKDRFKYWLNSQMDSNSNIQQEHSSGHY